MGCWKNQDFFKWFHTCHSYITLHHTLTYHDACIVSFSYRREKYRGNRKCAFYCMHRICFKQICLESKASFLMLQRFSCRYSTNDSWEHFVSLWDTQIGDPNYATPSKHWWLFLIQCPRTKFFIPTHSSYPVYHKSSKNAIITGPGWFPLKKYSLSTLKIEIFLL